jgi:hypothetical protein
MKWQTAWYLKQLKKPGNADMKPMKSLSLERVVLECLDEYDDPVKLMVLRNHVSQKLGEVVTKARLETALGKLHSIRFKHVVLVEKKVGNCRLFQLVPISK